jgi:V/A-type H+-transporting ATPase subunit B
MQAGLPAGHPLVRHVGLRDIVGDIVRLRARGVALGELASVRNLDGSVALARAVELDGEVVSLQVLSGAKGLSTDASVRFLGRPMRVPFSDNVLGRVLGGAGEPMDGGPRLDFEPAVDIGGPPVNPVMRVLPRRMIHTRVPMIDLFNCLVESQKIPIFSMAGEPYNALLARIGFQADADVIVFVGLGLIFDDYHFFRASFEEHGVFHRTAMFVNLASDPIVERILAPDLALAVAERFAVERGVRVLVLMTDMTAWCDALREVGITLERIPANRGYLGDLYTQLATRYEKACDFKGAGSVTILSVTTMPGNDVTHPVPDNTGYITEGQFYLHDGMLDPFGSLSRLKQHVIGKVTREDHAQLMNAMVRLYAGAQQAERKRAMAFDLSAFDRKLLEFGRLFRERMMRVEVSLPLERALDLGWQMLAQCFEPHELLIKQALVDKYFPRASAAH